jgi:two-component system chemotaxis response regulator CheY
MGEKGLLELVEGIATENISSKSYLKAMKKKDPIQPVIKKKTSSHDRFGLGAKVLVVDDELATCKVIGAILKQRKFEPIFASSVEEAIKVISHNPDINAIFCDYKMPKMTGLQFKIMLQKQKILQGVPFIIVSADRTPEVIKKAGQLGVSGWIIKPFNQDKLVHVLDQVSNQKLAG